MNRILVIAPHADDEILGVGGTIARFSKEGYYVITLIVTKGKEPLFDAKYVKKVRSEVKKAHKLIGISQSIFWDDFPAAMMDTVPHYKLNKALSDLIHEINPKILFLPFKGDLHFDHRLIFESVMVAIRPNDNLKIDHIMAYETLSETNWNAPYISPNFYPNVFVDISNYLDIKLKALSTYKSQLKKFPHERSLEAITHLAHLRGACVGVNAAEAFYLIRKII